MALGRETFPLNTAKNEVFLLTARLAGGGSGETLVEDEAFQYASEITSVARSSLGLFAITFRHKYPQMMALMEPVVVSSTAGLKARWTAYDAGAGTATLRCETEGGSAVPAWTSAVEVASHTAELAAAGMVIAVTITAGGVTGAANIRSDAPATSRDVQVEYDADGVATITFLAGDAVTEADVLVMPLASLADPGTSDEIHLAWVVRNRKV